MQTEVTYGAKRGAGKTREMVLKQHLRGLTNAQIAKKVGISRQAVGQHLARLRESGELEAS
jgi:DNA-directed RNA polymerase specialized sigma24 family protein